MENTVDREAELIANEHWQSVLGLWSFLKAALEYENADLLRCYINAMTYGTDGYPHVDSTRSNEETLMVYLCSEWRREWAGETCLWDAEQEEIEVAILPRPGRLVIFDGRRLHRASSVSRICPVARMTLMFKVAHAA
jgi:SM-20-related protein